MKKPPRPSWVYVPSDYYTGVNHGTLYFDITPAQRRALLTRLWWDKLLTKHLTRGNIFSLGLFMVAAGATISLLALGHSWAWMLVATGVWMASVSAIPAFTQRAIDKTSTKRVYTGSALHPVVGYAKRPQTARPAELLMARVVDMDIGNGGVYFSGVVESLMLAWEASEDIEEPLRSETKESIAGIIGALPVSSEGLRELEPVVKSLLEEVTALGKNRTMLDKAISRASLPSQVSMMTSLTEHLANESRSKNHAREKLE